MIFLGIDPGIYGALAAITDQGKIGVYDFDDVQALIFLQSIRNDKCKAVIEKIHSMPGQGVSSMFGMGENYGRWIGRLEALGIPYDLVTPQRWRKAMFDSIPATVPAPPGETPKEKQKRANERSKLLKELSRERALRLFPEMAEYLKLKKHHGRAEAILLGEYCRRNDK